jgi:hypothetical protein
MGEVEEGEVQQRKRRNTMKVKRRRLERRTLLSSRLHLVTEPPPRPTKAEEILSLRKGQRLEQKCTTLAGLIGK